MYPDKSCHNRDIWGHIIQISSFHTVITKLIRLSKKTTGKIRNGDVSVHHFHFCWQFSLIQEITVSLTVFRKTTKNAQEI